MFLCLNLTAPRASLHVQALINFAGLRLYLLWKQVGLGAFFFGDSSMGAFWKVSVPALVLLFTVNFGFGSEVL
ncbi:hypothetical protein B0J17DRAFT_641259 [Rhizoctonia solani]|nr:hypothetical protein B0J17DRAFT_641259 [Rhizoctonia solani]